MDLDTVIYSLIINRSAGRAHAALLTGFLMPPLAYYTLFAQLDYVQRTKYMYIGHAHAAIAAAAAVCAEEEKEKEVEKEEEEIKWR